MNKIIRVILSDSRRIKTNVVAVVIVIGLCVLPSLYAWFNILSNWDPYGSDAVRNIRVAVATEDRGISIKDFEYNLGDTVVSSLKSNDSVGWQFVDSSYEAIECVKSGDCYAAITLPEEFSEDMVSFLFGDLSHPTISYYRNEKKNAIAPKITDKVKNAVELQINEQFISTIAKSLIGATSAVLGTDVISDTSGNQNIIDALIKGLDESDDKLETLETVLNSLSILFKNASATTGALDAVYPDMNAAIVSGQDALESLKKVTQTGLLAQTGASSLGAGIDGISKGLDGLNEALKHTNTNMADITTVLDDANSSLETSVNSLISVRKSIQERIDKLDELRGSEAYYMLSKLMNNDSEEIGKFLASPVNIETEAIYPVTNYGSAMASFYTVLALWVGALFTVAVIHVTVHDDETIGDVKPRHKYFGRYAIFFGITQIQALITALGNIYYVEIQCEHKFLFWFAASISSFVFSLFMYSLTVALGNIGEGAAVVIMVIQVAGAGGTFPIETLPKVYQMIYKFLPFPYAMNAMRESVAGTYGMEYQKDIFVLLLYAVISLIIGLALAIPFRKMNHVIEKSKHQSGVMI